MKASVIFVGALPPPVHGLAVVNQSICDALAQAGMLYSMHDLGRGRSSSRVRNHAHRVRIALLTILHILRHASPKLSVYMGADAGFGLVYFLMIALATRLKGANIVLHHHSYSYIDRRARKMRCLLHCLGPRQLHLFLCDDMRARYAAQYANILPSTARFDILPNSFIQTSESPALAPMSAHKTLTIGHMSNLSRDKGTHIFLDLVERLHVDGHQVNVELAGPISDPTLADRIRRLFEGKVKAGRYWGPVDGEAKSEFFQAIDLFVFPTRYKHEAQPLVLLEALNAGRPVVTLRRGCISCDHSSTESLVIDSEDRFVEVATSWVGELLTEPWRVPELQKRARNRAQKERELGKVALQRVIREVLPSLSDPETERVVVRGNEKATYLA